MEDWTTGKLANKLGLSVRTIRYYDQIKLVSPSRTEAGGRRVYSEEDLIKLEKIVLLKKLGLSLDDIQDSLNELSTRQILEVHRKHLEEEAARMHEYIEYTTALLNFHQLDDELNWDTLLPLVRKPSSSRRIWQHYFNEEELKVLKVCLPRMENNDEMTNGWIRLIKRIEQCIQGGVEPHSVEGTAITAELNRLSDATFAGNTDLMDKFWKLRKDPNSAEQGLIPIRPEVIQFVEKCLSLNE
ncbi:MerR family transcriptional regulator [Paenibacillus sp. GSMTC-2017]|uniref:MerR family transcriptional regulator n=1 Tax=Paenibacillus sp. GSMTC-2017 TaxID=2794350 RepID=UPI0018D82E78|nr:MerR family transcriptional regulator [Paenibacillus sp. GSMTC-2017]MBH5316478.1 MerR family transcriptional regulator [Paenibacillus sp. GSMTC-2017]